MIKITRLIIFLIIFTISLGEQSYKLGDKIVLKIDALNIEQVEDGLKDFQIDKITESGDTGDYFVEIRSFKLGENRVKIGDNEIKFQILTNLKGDEEEIFTEYENNSLNKMKNLQFPYIIVPCFIGALYMIYSLVRGVKKEKILLPHEKYGYVMGRLSEERYPFEISYALREYIDSQFKSNFLEGFYKKNEVITDEDIKFITMLDYIKFSKNNDSSKETLSEKSDKIYKKIYNYKNIQELKKEEKNV